jgi:autotransporter-associated beta strand protein
MRADTKRGLAAILMALGASAGVAQAAAVTWNGGNYTWNNGDADSFGTGTYNNGDDVTFTNVGITNTVSGQTAITVSGALSPASVSFSHTQARYGSSSSTNPGGGLNYFFTSNGVANVITSTGDLTLGQGNAVFNAVTTAGTYTHSFAGALNYGNGSMLGLVSDNTNRIIRVQAGSLASPTYGNTIVFNSYTGAATNNAGADWAAAANRVVITGSKPAVTNNIVSPGLQHVIGGNSLGNFMTFSGNDLVPANAFYTGFATDWSAAGSGTIVNTTAAVTLPAGGAVDVYALRAANGSQTLGGRTVNLGSGGLIMTALTISGGTLNFGSGPGFIGAYNNANQATISAALAGTGGLTVVGTTQALNVTSTANSFTGGLTINGGNFALGSANAANGNDVVVNALGRLTTNVNTSTGATIGGLSGIGFVEAGFQGTSTSVGTLTIAPASGSFTFNGRMNDGDAGRVLNVIKSGAGTQVLGTAYVGSYLGGTTINAGKLFLNGVHTQATALPAAYTVNANATLGGSGSTNSPLFVAASGIIAPGNSAGTLSVGATTFSGTSVLDWELGAPWAFNGTNLPSPNDLLRVTGNLVLDGVVNVADLGGFTDGTYTLITYTGTLVNNTLTVGTLPAGTATVVIDATNKAVNLVVVGVPEPTTLAAAAGIALVALRRRKA